MNKRFKDAVKILIIFSLVNILAGYFLEYSARKKVEDERQYLIGIEKQILETDR